MSETTQEQIDAVFAELGIAFPLRNEITIANALVEARVTLALATQRAEAAEAERDALRKDAAAIAALREPISEGVDKGWSLLQTRCFESDPGMLDSVKYDDFQDALNAAIKAALAVQP